MAKPDLFENERLARIRAAVIIKGTPRFSRASHGVVCIQSGEVIHVETFYGDNGNATRAKARRYERQFLAGLSLGLESPTHRMPSLSSHFNTAANRAAIETAKAAK